jgi:hypothetical protein
MRHIQSRRRVFPRIFPHSQERLNTIEKDTTMNITYHTATYSYADDPTPRTSLLAIAQTEQEIEHALDDDRVFFVASSIEEALQDHGDLIIHSVEM